MEGDRASEPPPEAEPKGEGEHSASVVRKHAPDIPKAPAIPLEAVELAPTQPPAADIEVFVEMPASRPSMPSLPTALATFDRYHVLGRLAVGGMADIFLAQEVTPAGGRRHVALKLLRAQLHDEGEFEAMFLREGRVAMQLDHPNICHVHEFGKWGGHFFIAMQWIEGVHMRALLMRHAALGEHVPRPVTVWIVAEIAAALDYAHRARDGRRRPLHVVHRDVTPHNIMIGYDGVVKLLDFGVAKAREDNEVTISQSAALKGKFGYLSPEQCVGKPLDGRSDVFALGVCLYEALTMRRLYKRETQYATFEGILKEDVPSIRDVDPELPEELDGIVAKALAKKPADRYATAGDFEHDLRRFLAKSGEVISAARVRKVMREAFEDEMRSGPKLDTSKEALARLVPTASHPPKSSVRPPANPERPTAATLAAPAPSARYRLPLVVAGALALAVVIALAVGIGGDDDDPRAPETQPVVQDEPTATEPTVEPAPPERAAEPAEPEEEPVEAAEEDGPAATEPDEEEERRRERRERRRERAKMHGPMFLVDPGY